MHFVSQIPIPIGDIWRFALTSLACARKAKQGDRRERKLSAKRQTMSNLELAKKARELVLSNKPARLYKSIMRCVMSRAITWIGRLKSVVVSVKAGLFGCVCSARISLRLLR